MNGQTTTPSHHTTTDTAPDTRRIVVEEVFPHARELVWKALTARELLGRWMPMPPDGFEAVRGACFTMKTKPAGEWDGTIRCEVLEVVQHERLAYRWVGGHEGNVGYGAPLDTVVTFTLTRVEHGTRLRLEHTGFVVPRNDTAYKGMSDGWPKVVRALGAAAGDVR
ncbi:MAG: SRPBCC domain-containing protein [Lautropia sp.]